MDPLSAGVFASIGSAFKFADVAVRIAEVGSENAVFVRAICVVRSDLEEVERLLSLESIQTKLNGTPGKFHWIKNAIQNTKCALNEIGRWVERARVEQETTGSIKFDTRVRWVFSDHEKLLNRKTELTTCHQQLSNVLGYLAGLETIPINTVLSECEDSTHLDDILARHKRPNRPIGLNIGLEKSSTVRDNTLAHKSTTYSEPTTFGPPPLESAVWNSQNQFPVTAYEQHGSERSPPLSSSLFPPGSPPPTYATVVSLDALRGDICSSSYRWNAFEKDNVASQSVGQRKALSKSCENTWAYRSDPAGMAVPELAEDTVLFSATNSAGPVNPYELCANTVEPVSENNQAAQRPYEDFTEMLSGLQIPVELPSNNISPPPGYPPLLRASEKGGLARLGRTTSETPPMIHRRPLPATSLSDPLITVHELPTALTAQHITIPSSYEESRAAIRQSYNGELLSPDSHQPYIEPRPVSNIALQSHESTAGSASTRHYYAPPPMAPALKEYAVAFSADSTSRWGLDTEPKGPKAPSAQGPTTFTRIQSQKRIMDLLSSIGT